MQIFVHDYLYDGEGNRIQRKAISTGEITTYEWDYRNRLVGWVQGNKSVSYLYDAMDRRIAKSIDGVVTERYGHDGNDLTLVTSVAGQVVQRYLYGGAIDEVLAEENSTGVNWALADRLGSIDLVVNDTGAVVDQVSYDSFGRKISDLSPYNFRFGFTGREFDPETNQYYYRARYYDQSVGRFISTDPIGLEAGDTNLYRYVFNSPTHYTDPTGHEWDWGKAWNGFWGGVGETWNTVSNEGWSILRGAADEATNVYTGIIADGQKEGGLWGGLKQAGGYLGYTFSSLPKTINDFGQGALEFGVNLKLQGEKTGGVLGFAQQAGGYAIGLSGALLNKDNIGSTIATVSAGIGALKFAGTKVGAAILANPAVRTTLNTVGIGQGIVKVQEAAFGFDSTGKELAPEERILRLVSGTAEIIVPGVDIVKSKGIQGTAAAIKNAGTKALNYGTRVLSGEASLIDDSLGILNAGKAKILAAGESLIAKATSVVDDAWQALGSVKSGVIRVGENAIEGATAFRDKVRGTIDEIWQGWQSKSTGTGVKTAPEGGVVANPGKTSAPTQERPILPDPWLEPHSPSNQSGIIHGNVDLQPPGRNIPDGWVPQADDSIIATPSRMLPPAKEQPLLPDPWLEVHHSSNQGNAIRGVEPRSPKTLVPEGWIQQADDSIVATPSRMLASGNQVLLGPDSVYIPRNVSIRWDLPGHMLFDGIKQGPGKLNGTHNLDSLNQAVIDHNIKIDSVASTSVKGISIAQYRVKKLDGSGSYKNPQIKTVYDPSIISDAEIIRLGQIAALKGYEKNVALGNRQYTENAGGIDFRVYLDNNLREITNIHPQ
jgi:RHS repeat-associated protein